MSEVSLNETGLSEFMKTNPDGTLEDIARQYQTSLLDVVDALPSRTLVGGEKFDAVWDELTTWGPLTTLVHNHDVILEFHGELPSGFHRHGYFNLRGKNGLSGHIKAENVRHIALIERPFMGMATASIVFFNEQKQAMFKVFLGRDSHRQLLPEQVEAFRRLGAGLASGAK
ncbi:heme utilization carrier protein [Leminorella grimontii]|uniref:Heme utilization carrier protein n=1 Tax=Leminorella grimontii TaxID=82981 RepID=A0AAV5N0D1_9GAMM|nr:putative heme iron utilization protein [Leminorella grimontii ATCC 33999 = DSM 5078]GKX54604.1 heme utilization carrier protein [Leminorella grimontii]GKX58022.1 heme utilization carrier protein [Leminorella grimontii]VFS58836.1 Putative heme iron utilization protein [Leminorella grimontii]